MNIREWFTLAADITSIATALYPVAKKVYNDISHHFHHTEAHDSHASDGNRLSHAGKRHSHRSVHHLAAA